MVIQPMLTSSSPSSPTADDIITHLHALVCKGVLKVRGTILGAARNSGQLRCSVLLDIYLPNNLWTGKDVWDRSPQAALCFQETHLRYPATGAQVFLSHQSGGFATADFYPLHHTKHIEMVTCIVPKIWSHIIHIQNPDVDLTFFYPVSHFSCIHIPTSTFDHTPLPIPPPSPSPPNPPHPLQLRLAKARAAPLPFPLLRLPLYPSPSSPPP